MSAAPVRPRMRVDVQRYQRTGRPVTVLPMTRRWISDVPSKMVKILGRDFAPLVNHVYAGKAAYGPALLGLGRTENTSRGLEMLPVCSQKRTERCHPSHRASITPPNQAE